jgi:hypothetical protein
MALVLPQEPAQGRATVSKALDEARSSAANTLTAGGAVSGSMSLLRAAPDGVATSLPHQVYDLGIDAIASNKGLEAATPNGWRYVLEDTQKPIAFAELNSDGKSFVSFNTGPFPAALCAAISRAEQLDYVQSQNVDLRVLRIAALYVIALWLHGQTDKTDVIIPVPPVAYKLAGGRPYSAADFLELLRDAAKRAMNVIY